MPHLPTARRTRKERCKDHVVHQDALRVACVEFRRPRVARLHRADLGQERGLRRTAVAQFANRVGAESIDRPKTDGHAGAGVVVTVNLQKVIVAACADAVVGKSRRHLREAAEIRDDKLPRKPRTQVGQRLRLPPCLHNVAVIHDLIPDLDDRRRRTIRHGLGECVDLPAERRLAGVAREPVAHRPRIRRVNRLAEDGRLRVVKSAKLLQRELDANAPLRACVRKPLKPVDDGGIDLPEARHHVPERVAAPDANVVAAVCGEAVEPPQIDDLRLAVAAIAEVDANRHERLAVRLEVARILRRDRQAAERILLARHHAERGGGGE